MCTIPHHITELLPAGNLTVAEFLTSHFPPQHASTTFTQPDDYLCASPPTCRDFNPLDIPIPPTAVVTSLSRSLSSMEEDLESVRCPHAPQYSRDRYPLWLLSFWEVQIGNRSIKAKWQSAIRELDHQLENPSRKSIEIHAITKEAKEKLIRIPWTGTIKGFSDFDDILKLTAYCTREWLATVHENNMIELIHDALALSWNSPTQFSDTYHAQFIADACADPDHYMSTRGLAWLRTQAQDLATGVYDRLGTIANAGGNHWVALVLDFRMQKVFYGDSLGQPFDDVLKRSYDWWTHLHTNTTFDWAPMEITRQTDGFSCGLLAANALEHHLSPTNHPLMDARDVAKGRLEVLLKVLDRQLSNTIRSEAIESEFTVNGQVSESDSGSDTEHSTKPCSSPPSSPSESPRFAFKTSTIPTPSINPLIDYDSASDDGQNASSSAANDALIPIAVKRKVNWDDSEDAEEPTKPAVSTKKQKVIASTSRALAVANTDDGTKVPPLLRFFKKETREEREERWKREAEAERENWESRIKQAEQNAAKKKKQDRENARLRKQKSRAAKREQEIEEGIRDKEGNVRKKRKTVPMDLRDVDMKPIDDIAEKSRPARAIKEQIKQKTRKPAGRKQIRTKRAAKYMNWSAPFCWSQIKATAKKVGWDMSPTAIVRELQRQDPETFGRLRKSTVNEWIDRSGSVPCWKKSVLERAERGNTPGHDKGGCRGILAKYPELVERIRQQLDTLRELGTPLCLISVRAIIVATISKEAPEIFDVEFRDGSRFRVSDSYCRKFLRGTMSWSERKATKAAQKLPDNWEDVCEKAFLRRAQEIKEDDIPIQLVVNSDQTFVIYNPGSQLTWAPRGARQVSLINADKKRGFTALLSISAAGYVLSIQCVFGGKTSRVCPSAKAPCYASAIQAGFRFVASGKPDNHWSNQETMQDFVDNILAPYFDKQKDQLELPSSQKSLWIIDVWSVHRSDQFLTWMRKNHPTIIIDFVPGNCTNVAQPLDVGINRIFKQSMKRSYHAYLVDKLLLQMDEGKALEFDTHLGPLRDASVGWLWDAYNTIQNKELVMRAFEMCEVRDWNLSFKCLTSFKARERLRNLKVEDPGFWQELNVKSAQDLRPTDEEEVTEDNVPELEEDEGPDDSDVRLIDVVTDVSTKKVKARLAKTKEGGLASQADADGELVPDSTLLPQELSTSGKGKRLRRPNVRYHGWWRHANDNGEDLDRTPDMEPEAVPEDVPSEPKKPRRRKTKR